MNGDAHKTVMKNAKLKVVSIEKVDNIDSEEEIKKILFKTLDHIKHLICLPKDAVIVVKVNLCLLIGPETGGTVDPRVAKSLCSWFFENYQIKKIFLAEADATHLDADMAFKVLNWSRISKEDDRIELLNLSKDEQVEVAPYQATYLTTINMSKILMEADLLVSLAKLKTHTQQKITCILKNQFGAISNKYKVTYHCRLAEAICDAIAVRLPELCVIDGLVSMEGNGPTNGTPKRTKLLLCGNDPVAMDHFCSKLIGFKPHSVPHLKLAMKRGIGFSEYQIFGTPPLPLNQNFKFLPKWKEMLKKGIGLLQQRGINDET